MSDLAHPKNYEDLGYLDLLTPEEREVYELEIELDQRDPSILLKEVKAKVFGKGEPVLDDLMESVEELQSREIKLIKEIPFRQITKQEYDSCKSNTKNFFASYPFLIMIVMLASFGLLLFAAIKDSNGVFSYGSIPILAIALIIMVGVSVLLGINTKKLIITPTSEIATGTVVFFLCENENDSDSPTRYKVVVMVDGTSKFVSRAVVSGSEWKRLHIGSKVILRAVRNGIIAIEIETT